MDDLTALVAEMLDVYGVRHTDAHSREENIASWGRQFAALLAQRAQPAEEWTPTATSLERRAKELRRLWEQAGQARRKGRVDDEESLRNKATDQAQTLIRDLLVALLAQRAQQSTAYVWCGRCLAEMFPPRAANLDHLLPEEAQPEPPKETP